MGPKAVAWIGQHGRKSGSTKCLCVVGGDDLAQGQRLMAGRGRARGTGTNLASRAGPLIFEIMCLAARSSSRGVE